MPKTQKWIFFDFDGTLVDSVEALYRAYQDFVSFYQVKASPEEFESLIGPSIPEIVRLLKQKHGLNEDEPSLLNHYLKTVEEVYQSQVKPMPEATQILTALKKDQYCLALVTSSLSSWVLPWLKKQQWDELFDQVCCADQISLSKPHPEIYQKALVQSGSSAGQVVVVEDSKNGLKAAAAAGLKTIAYRYFSIEQEWSISELGQLPLILQVLEQGCLQGDVVFEQMNSPLKDSEIGDPHMAQQWANRPPHVFDGPIWSVGGIASSGANTTVQLVKTSYKSFWLSRQQKSYGISPLGVMAITYAEEKGERFVLWAKRSKNVLQYPSCFELAPSGGVSWSENPPIQDQIKQSLYLELVEELQLQETNIDKCDPLGVVWDSLSHTWDVVFAMKLHSKVETAHVQNQEYEQAFWVKQSELEQFLEEHALNLVEASRSALKMWQEFLKTKGKLA